MCGTGGGLAVQTLRFETPGTTLFLNHARVLIQQGFSVGIRGRSRLAGFFDCALLAELFSFDRGFDDLFAYLTFNLDLVVRNRYVGDFLFLDALAWQSVGGLSLEPIQQVLSHVAAQVPQVTAVRSADHHAYFHGFRIGIRDLHIRGAAVPQVRVVQQSLHFGA